MPRILVLYAKSCFIGHKVIAENYAELLASAGFEVVLGDVFEIDKKAVIPGGEKIYFWWLEHWPWFWKFLNDFGMKIPGAKWFKNWLLPRQYKKTQQFIIEQSPDLIITTHPVATGIADFVRRKLR